MSFVSSPMSTLFKSTSRSSSEYGDLEKPARTTKSPLLACLPGVFNKFSSSTKKSIGHIKSEFSSYKDVVETMEPSASLAMQQKLQKQKQKQNQKQAVAQSTENTLSTQPPLEFNFNNVINFTVDEIIASKHSQEHDSKNDEEIYSKHSFNLSGSDVLNAAQVDTSHRLHRLRQLMIVNNVDVYIVPSEDEHQSEYTAPCDNRREYICGFGGSSGVALISLEKAALSTDSRYFLEAEKTLDDNWSLLKHGVSGYPTWQEWALRQLKASKHKTLSLDPKLVSLSLGRYFEDKCKEIGATFKPLFNNFIDEIWDNQPKRSDAPVYELPYKFTGATAGEKILKIRSSLAKENATGIIVTKLDDIAWTLNLRGSDFENSPLFFAYLIVSQNEVRLYIETEKLRKEVESYLHVEIKNLKVKEYSEFWIDIDALSINFESYYYLLPNDVSYGLINKLSIINYKFSSLIETLKSVKSPTELYGMKLAHVKDGIALVRYFAWLEEKLIKEGRTLNEYQAGLKSEYYRSLMANYRGLSFPTISASGANAASNHYEPTFEINSIIDPEKIYLCDSGAQYFDGTTDITRTVHFTKPLDEEKIAYTAVLKGHIAIARAQFPVTTTGVTLDCLARAPLWAEGLDYRHGTGHGIGSFLNVHEGPIYFGRNCTFLPGQIISDEPGYYKDYHYGMRIESDLEIMKNPEKKDLNGKEFLRFGYLTMCPFDLNLIEKGKLSSFEADWINAYHIHVRNVLTPYLMKFNDIRAAKWLYKQTEAL